jgi:hypothetical protein
LYLPFLAASFYLLSPLPLHCICPFPDASFYLPSSLPASLYLPFSRRILLPAFFFNRFFVSALFQTLPSTCLLLYPLLCICPFPDASFYLLSSLPASLYLPFSRRFLLPVFFSSVPSFFVSVFF